MTHLIRTSILVLLAACASLSAAQDRKSTAAAEYKLAAGDAIKIQVYQNPDLTLETRVSESGTINYPLVGSVPVGGISISTAEGRIAAALQKSNILKQPQVNIVLLQVRGNQVSVLGHVQRPGRFPLETTNVRVSDVLAMAGGVTPQGEDAVVVSGTRNGQLFRRRIDIPNLFRGDRPAEDLVLEGGDTLYVDKANTFYIYGEAQRPGTYKIERGMTMQQALAQGGGHPRAATAGARQRAPAPEPHASGRQRDPDRAAADRPGDAERRAVRAREPVLTKRTVEHP